MPGSQAVKSHPLCTGARKADGQVPENTHLRRESFAAYLARRPARELGAYVDELDAIYFMATTIFGYTMKQVRCTTCGYAHLDRDWFSVHPHVRHLCAGCAHQLANTQPLE